ncbi:MAG: DUF507 family protein [Acidobacteriia bacterium]|nr:DUF507 family protein [Terriglobia bacterium]
MQLAKEFVSHMAFEIVDKLIERDMIEARDPDQLVVTFRDIILEELSMEDKLNEEVRALLNQHSDTIRQDGISYQEMFRKIKTKLARERKIVL